MNRCRTMGRYITTSSSSARMTSNWKKRDRSNTAWKCATLWVSICSGPTVLRYSGWKSISTKISSEKFGWCKLKICSCGNRDMCPMTAVQKLPTMFFPRFNRWREKRRESSSPKKKNLRGSCESNKNHLRTWIVSRAVKGQNLSRIIQFCLLVIDRAIRSEGILSVLLATILSQTQTGRNLFFQTISRIRIMTRWKYLNGSIRNLTTLGRGWITVL